MCAAVWENSQNTGLCFQYLLQVPMFPRLFESKMSIIGEKMGVSSLSEKVKEEAHCVVAILGLVENKRRWRYGLLCAICSNHRRRAYSRL